MKANKLTDDLLNKCIECEIPAHILNIIKEKYNEPHRYYHNWSHVIDLVRKCFIDDDKNPYYSDLLKAILFHDVIYDPTKNDNEEQSAAFFRSFYSTMSVYDAIINTKTHTNDTDFALSAMLNKLDMSILYSDFKTFADYEYKIFKEYQYVDYVVYKENRLKFLKSVGDINPFYIDYVENKKYNIGVYPGSFNPFTVGHLDILKKAECIFDKVIIARGINTNKDNELIELPQSLKYHQVELYDGLLTDFIESLNYDVTVIRGLRNSTDFDYEKTQYRFLKDLKKDIKVVNIIADAEFEHISSSSVRLLDKYNKGDKYKIL